MASAVITSPIGPLVLEASERGLRRVSFTDSSGEAAGGDPTHAEASVLAQAKQELDEYFAGQRREFSVSLDLEGQGFSRAVLDQLARVPYGRLTTYGALAEAAGNALAARAVGTVMNRNPLPIILPCHRVIGASGDLVGYGGGLERKRALLALEGAPV